MSQIRELRTEFVTANAERRKAIKAEHHRLMDMFRELSVM